MRFKNNNKFVNPLCRPTRKPFTPFSIIFIIHILTAMYFVATFDSLFMIHQRRITTQELLKW